MVERTPDARNWHDFPRCCRHIVAVGTSLEPSTVRLSPDRYAPMTGCAGAVDGGKNAGADRKREAGVIAAQGPASALRDELILLWRIHWWWPCLATPQVARSGRGVLGRLLLG